AGLADADRLTAVTRAPAAARCRAIASPMPLGPPVTTATRPERSRRFFGGVSVLTGQYSLWGRGSSRRHSPPARTGPSGLASLQELSADHQALDLARAFPDLVDADVAVEALQRELRGVAGGPVDLEGVRHDSLGHVRRDQLRLGGLADDGAALVLEE